MAVHALANTQRHTRVSRANRPAAVQTTTIRMRLMVRYVLNISMMSSLLGCGENTATSGGEDNEQTGGDEGDCEPGTYRCVGQNVERCDDNGFWQYLQSCGAHEVCSEGSCLPGDSQPCESDDECEPDEACLDGFCKEQNLEEFKISGVVTDWVTGDPISGVVVRIRTGAGPACETDSSGAYSLPGVVDGEYDLDFRTEDLGYEWFSRSIAIAVFDSDKTVDAELVPSHSWGFGHFSFDSGLAFDLEGCHSQDLPGSGEIYCDNPQLPHNSTRLSVGFPDDDQTLEVRLQFDWDGDPGIDFLGDCRPSLGHVQKVWCDTEDHCARLFSYDGTDPDPDYGCYDSGQVHGYGAITVTDSRCYDAPVIGGSWFP